MTTLAKLTRQAIGGLFFVLVLMAFLHEPAPTAVFIDLDRPAQADPR